MFLNEVVLIVISYTTQTAHEKEMHVKKMKVYGKITRKKESIFKLESTRH